MTTRSTTKTAPEDPLAKALWYIESHFTEKLALDDVAAVAGVSPFHLTRAFGFALGVSVMRYIRHRRLTQAARRLAEGEPDILGLALDAGYGSHEAFSRAFRERFGLSPNEVRRQGGVDNLDLQEAAAMQTPTPIEIDDPAIVDGKPLLLAGLSRTYSFESNAGIPSQWQDFQPHLGHVPGQVGEVAYGVICNGDDEGNYEYLCAVEVADFTQLAPEQARLRVPEQRYAVFSLATHVSTVKAACHAAWGDWLPRSGYEAADAPFFERYPESFDPATGEGGFEIWLPLKR